jgi:SAM-dependent methyltransferase
MSEVKAASAFANRHGAICPIDHGRLTETANCLVCDSCKTLFPIIDGIPILINDSNSIFRVGDYATESAYGGASSYGGSLDRTSGIRRLYRSFVYKLTEAPIRGAPFDGMALIHQETANPRCLIIGSGERTANYDVVRTDVVLSKNVDYVCDAHDIPFPDASFDVVVASSVLEHVCDPQRCVAEMVRILKPGGFVLANTPFLQPVHMGAYDFTRFTRLGHRRLFRNFDEIASGVSGGPAYAATYILQNLVANLSDDPKRRRYLKLIGLLTTYPLRFLDPLFTRTKSSNNAASAFYFVGRKRSEPIPDRAIVDMFIGI